MGTKRRRFSEEFEREASQEGRDGRPLLRALRLLVGPWAPAMGHARKARQGVPR